MERKEIIERIETLAEEMDQNKEEINALNRKIRELRYNNQMLEKEMTELVVELGWHEYGVLSVNFKRLIKVIESLNL